MEEQRQFILAYIWESNVSFMPGLYCLDIGGTYCIGNEIMPTVQ